MITSNSRISQLKQMIVLEGKRATLESQLQDVDVKLSSLQTALYAKPIQSRAPVAAPVKRGKAGRKQRGALRGQILEALEAAGSRGATVKELSSVLAVQIPHIHSWFSANIKKISGIKKIGPAHYQLAVAAAAPVKAVKPGKAAKPVKGKAPAKAAKVTAKAPAKKVKRARRGALKEQILAQLTKAGSPGITIKDLSEQLGIHYRNVYVWFVTTGKGVAGIKKMGPARYKLDAAA